MAVRYYAGIGSRQTPPDVLEQMTLLARLYAGSGFILRSGHAAGADQAFERGAGEQVEVYLPWPSYNMEVPKKGFLRHSARPGAFKIAEQFHPAWGELGYGARRMHARNSHIILGDDLDVPVEFVVCWTKDGRREGGTGQALRIAEHYGIPIYDLALTIPPNDGEPK